MQALGKVLQNTDLLLGAALLVVVSMLVLPLPHAVMDAALVVAIAASVVILLVSVNVKEPLEFSVFPSMLLITTLYRLALSIGATKLILGTGDGGHVIQTFGEVVVGGNFAVGMVSFIILMIVQFLVITNGAGRVSEVVARFTLDAMPGKQMAIDADLAAGLIDEDQARERRKAVKKEADFYGSMDGASKFVKGDAIASLLIIVVNIVGGFAVGFMNGQGDANTVMQTYALLAVGEGLVSQIPALLISTSAGLLVTRNGQETGMGSSLFTQILAHPRVLKSASAILVGFAFVPGMPKMIFFGFAALIFGVAHYMQQNPEALTAMAPKPKDEPSSTDLAPAGDAAPAPSGPDAVLPLIHVDALEIEVGYALTRLADPRVGGDLSERVGATRQQIALELGYVMPSVRIRDNESLAPNEYRLKVRGEDVAQAEVYPEMLLAIGAPGLGPIPGVPTQEPVFQMDAFWIDPALQDTAEREGYTIVKPEAMLATHLAEVVKDHAAELLSRQDVTKLLDNAKQVNETVVNDLIPETVSVGEVQKVLQHLLRERVPIRDMVTILETVADFAPRVKEVEQLGELVRSAMARTITRQHMDEGNRLSCVTLDPELERALTEAVNPTSGGLVLAVDPELQQRLVNDVQRAAEAAAVEGQTPVLLCSAGLRLPLRKLVERYVPELTVLAYNEVAAKAEVEFVAQVSAAA